MQMTRWVRGGLASVLAVSLTATADIAARDATHKGTVTAVDKARIQVRLVDEAGKAPAKPEWFSVAATTRIVRGDAVVTFATARIKVGERVAVRVGDGDESGVDWVCPMHPQTARAGAGVCPMCGMTLKARARPAKAAEIHVEVP